VDCACTGMTGARAIRPDNSSREILRRQFTVKNGRVASWRMFQEQAEALEAVGLRE
jgi:hypothetical protein